MTLPDLGSSLPDDRSVARPGACRGSGLPFSKVDGSISVIPREDAAAGNPG